MKSVSSDTRLETITRSIRLEGITPIMFDRYPGDNKTKLTWYQKVYLIPDTDVLCIPAINITSFLSAHNTDSAPKRLRDVRQYKKIANACLSYLEFKNPTDQSAYLPFTRDGKPIRMGDPGRGGEDPLSGLFMHRAYARLKTGIPNPQERPVLPLPWALDLQMTIIQNKEIKEQEIRNLMQEGGIAIGLGTYRGVFGKFQVTRWQ